MAQDLNGWSSKLTGTVGPSLVNASAAPTFQGEYADAFRHNARITTTMTDTAASNLGVIGNVKKQYEDAVKKFAHTVTSQQLTKKDMEKAQKDVEEAQKRYNEAKAKVDSLPADKKGDALFSANQSLIQAQVILDDKKNTLDRKKQQLEEATNEANSTIDPLVGQVNGIQTETAFDNGGQRPDVGASSLSAAKSKFTAGDMAQAADEPGLPSKAGDKSYVSLNDSRNDDGADKKDSSNVATATSSSSSGGEQTHTTAAGGGSSSSGGTSGGGGGSLSSGGGGGSHGGSSSLRKKAGERKKKDKDKDDKDDKKGHRRKGGKSKDKDKDGDGKTTTRTGDGDVAVVGDSTTEQLKDKLMTSLEGANPDGQVLIDSLGGRSMYEGNNNGMEAIRNIKSQLNGKKADWVMGMGVNDSANISVGSSVSAKQRIDDAMEELSDQGTVYWPLLDIGDTSQTGYTLDDVSEFNNALKEAEKEYPNLVVTDWDIDDSEYSDGIHYNQQGMDDRVDMITNLVDENGNNGFDSGSGSDSDGGEKRGRRH